MKKIHGGISLFRAANLGNILPFSVIVMGFTGFVLLRALSVSYSGVPWFAWPIVGFVLGGFVFMFLAGFGTLLFCTQRVEIGSDEIVVRLGPLVFRRMQALSVHTIGFGEIAFGKGNPTFDGFLILSSRTPDEVEAAGRRILEKKRTVRYRYLRRGIDLDDRAARCRAWFDSRMLYLLLGFDRDILLGFTPERLKILKENIPGAVSCAG